MELINHKNAETYAITQRTSSKVRRPSTLMNSDFLILVLLFVCFSIEPTASHFNMYCLHFSVLSSVSNDQ
jgi:hypothetical protein